MGDRPAKRPCSGHRQRREEKREMIFGAALYLSAAILLLASFVKDKKKTRMSLKKAWKSLDNILPQFLSIIVVIGLSLAVLSPEDINGIIGTQSGWPGMIAAAVIGSVTLIPGFVAFPLTAALYETGAGIVQLAVFICTLMAVGVITLPVEIKFLGLRASIARNAMAFLFSFIAAGLMGVILK